MSDTTDEDSTDDNVVDINDARVKKTKDEATVKVWELAKDIDRVMANAIENGVSPFDVAGIVANRLGEICGAIDRATGGSIINSCVRIMERQANKEKK